VISVLTRFLRSCTHLCKALDNQTILQFRWTLGRTLGVYFLIFGFFGWGIIFPSIGTPISIVNNLLVIGTPILLFYFRKGISEYFTFKPRISLLDAFAVFGIWISLVVINFDWVTKSLTGDELSYALKSHIHSFRLLLILEPYLPDSWRMLSSAGLIQAISIVFMLLIGLLIFRHKFSNFSSISLGLIIFLLITSRILLYFLGATSLPNSPTPSIILFTFTSILGLSDEGFRLSASLLAAIFIYCSGRTLRQRKAFGIPAEVLLNVCLVILYSSYRLTLSPEISFMGIPFMGFILVKWCNRPTRMDASLVLAMAFLVSFRASSVILVLAILLHYLLFSRKLGADFRSGMWSPFVLCIPVLTTFIMSRYSGKSLVQDTSSVAKRVGDFLEVLSTSGMLTLVLLSPLFVLIYNQGVRELTFWFTFFALYVGLFLTAFIGFYRRF